MKFECCLAASFGSSVDELVESIDSMLVV